MNSMAARRLLVTSTARTSLRTQRSAFRPVTFPRTQARRGYADAVNKTTETATNHAPSIVGGIVGGSLVFLAAYGWYRMSGASTFVDSMHKVKSTFDTATKSVQNAAPEPSEALNWLRQTSLSYAAFIPGAKYYVGKAFDDLDIVHQKHAGEVDEIVQDACSQLKAATKKNGLSLDSAGEAMSILGDAMNKIMALAGDAGEDLLNNHPEIKSQLGGSIKQLQAMGNNSGLKKEIDETWEQLRGLASKGFSASTITDAKKLLDDKVAQLKQLGDKAWDKGLEQMKPYLDKAPQAKELIEKNKDALMKGDIGTLIQKLKDAASSGNVDDLKSYIESAADKAKQTGKDAMGSGSLGGGLEKYISLIPGGGEIASKLQQLSEVGQKHGKEAESLLTQTVNEIQEILSKRMQDAEKLADKASKDAKK